MAAAAETQGLRAMILVTGATGNVGSVLIPLLVGSGASVRAFTRSAEKAASIAGAGADVAIGDLENADSLAGALQGCSHLFLLSPPSPHQVAREMAAIDAANRAGIEYVVALSVLGSNSSSPSVLGRWHAAIDEYLIRSAIDYTILRPTGFMQVHLSPKRSLAVYGEWHGITGDGASAYIDVGDVAAVAAAALMSSAHIGREYDLTGPEAITMRQAAALLAELTGRDVPYVDVSPERLTTQLLDAELPSWAVEELIGLYQWIATGQATTVNSTVQEVLGRSARSYREVISDNLSAFL